MGLAKIKTYSSSYMNKGSKHENGFQFDLLIERADGVINVCEMKYYNSYFTIDKTMYQKTKGNLAKFQAIAGNKYVLHYTIVTANGCLQNAYYQELVDEDIQLKHLI